MSHRYPIIAKMAGTIFSTIRARRPSAGGQSSPDPSANPPRDDGSWSPSALSRSQGLRQLLFMAAIFFLVCFWIHFPGIAGNTYSDLMDTLWQRILHAPGIVPYVDYNLEYPAVSAIVLYFSSLWDNMYAFYVSTASILFVSMIGALLVVHRALRERGEPVQNIAYFIIFTPSFVYFSIYSFDWIGAAFMVASLYFGYKRQALRSGAFIGLAAAARIIPIVCLPFLFLAQGSRRDRLVLLASAGGAWLAVNAYFILTNLKGFLYPYQFQAGFGVEDSWLGLVSPYEKETSILLIVTALAFIVYKREKFNLYQQALLAMIAFVLASFKFPPQYMILLLPLFALTGVSYAEFMVVNILNVMLIFWYFTPVFNLGDPIVVTSPVQWIAYARQLILFFVFAKVVMRGGKSSPGEESEPSPA